MPMAKKARKTASADNGRIGVIYARYSSHSQRDVSIEQQVNECRKFAEEMDIPITKVYADRAVSGRTDKRPQFQQMMKDANTGAFSCVIAWKSNRMGRNMLQAMYTEDTLNRLGIRCLYVEEDFEDTAAGRFALRNMMNVNQFYSENMAEDIRRGMMDNAAQCKVNGYIPFGLKKGEDGKYAIDENKAPIVHEVFRRVAEGEQYAAIARDLTARGIRSNYGKEFGRTSLQAMIHNEKYRGVYQFAEVRVENGIPRIVDDDLFYRVQEVVKTKKNPEGAVRNSGDYLLTGKLFCGHCRSPMIGVSGTSRTGNPHHYYKCQKKHRTKDCQKKNVRRDDIETAVTKALMNYALTDEAIEKVADFTMDYFKRKEEESGILLMEEELAGVEKSLGNILKAIEIGIINETTQERMLELENERKNLKGKIALAKNDYVPVDRETVVEGLKMFRKGRLDDQRFRMKLFDLFLKAVYVYDDDRIEIFFSYDKNKNGMVVNLGGAISDAVVRMGDKEAHHFISYEPGIDFYFINGLVVLVSTVSFFLE